MAEQILTDELRSWIGREATYTAPEELGRASLRYFARAVGDDNPVYTDDDAARAAGFDGVIAPPTFVCETNQYADRERDEHGYIGHLWELPLRDCRIIRGGHEYRFGQPVRPDDVLTVTWRITDITEKTSRAGRPMLLVVSEADYTNQRGEWLASNRETTIYQPLPTEGAA
jgi:acyl dehydratase